MGGYDDIWYATNIEIVDYMNDAGNLKYTIDQDLVYNPSVQSVQSVQSVWISVDDEGVEIKGGVMKKI